MLFSAWKGVACRKPPTPDVLCLLARNIYTAFCSEKIPLPLILLYQQKGVLLLPTILGTSLLIYFTLLILHSGISYLSILSIISLLSGHRGQKEAFSANS